MSQIILKTLGLLRVAPQLIMALGKNLTPRPSTPLGVLLLLVPIFACGQSNDDIQRVFDGIDIETALTRVDEMGITPYDFGMKLLDADHREKAIKWYNLMGIKNSDLQFVYGLAWCKWITGDNTGALEDAGDILGKNPSPIIHARTLYLIGAASIDEEQFKKARGYLQAGFEAYGAMKNKPGGQYLCKSMMAWYAVFEGEYDKVEPLLDEALSWNEKSIEMGFDPYGMGRKEEIISELRLAQGDNHSALIAADASISAYRADNESAIADDVESKKGILLILTGEPKAAKRLASKLWKKHQKSPNKGRLLALNSITLMKLSMCSHQDQDADERERAARAWAQTGPGGKAMLKLLEWVKDENNVPCPQWR